MSILIPISNTRTAQNHQQLRCYVDFYPCLHFKLVDFENMLLHTKVDGTNHLVEQSIQRFYINVCWFFLEFTKCVHNV